MASNKSGWSERELIFNIAEIFAATNPAVLVGIGDDAAMLARPENHIVVTTDMAVEDVHFKVNWSSAEEIGRKVAAANLADIYAMGGRPKYLTVAMSATGNEELEWMLGIARGIAHEAKIVGAQVVGGDLAKGEKIVISITAIGECEKEILRSGAKVGDSIYITTLPGWSAAGLLALQKNIRGGAVDFAISEHRAPSVDYDNAEQIAVGANSLCDISDSLMIQAEQMAGACLVPDASANRPVAGEEAQPEQREQELGHRGVTPPGRSAGSLRAGRRHRRAGPSRRPGRRRRRCRSSSRGRGSSDAAACRSSGARR